MFPDWLVARHDSFLFWLGFVPAAVLGALAMFVFLWQTGRLKRASKDEPRDDTG